MILDMSRIPTEQVYCGFDLAEVVHGARPAIDTMTRSGLIKPHASFGFVLTDPNFSAEELQANWDNPYGLGWLAVHWGPEGQRYAANALRKLRAAARNLANTLELREAADADTTKVGDYFRDIVDSQEPDGSYKNGDFPWGGGVLLKRPVGTLGGAVSCLRQREDHHVASLLVDTVDRAMTEIAAA
jgi:hypothetical protein